MPPHMLDQQQSPDEPMGARTFFWCLVFPRMRGKAANTTLLAAVTTNRRRLVLDALVWGGDTRLITGAISRLAGCRHRCARVQLPAYRRLAGPGYIAMLTFSVCGLFLPAAESFAGFPGTVLIARLPQRRRAWFALAWAALPLAINVYTGRTFHPDAPLSLTLINTGLWLVLIIGVWIAGRALARTHNRLTTERQWAEAATEEARAMERVRISRDLHDTVAHSLTGILLQVADSVRPQEPRGHNRY